MDFMDLCTEWIVGNSGFFFLFIKNLTMKSTVMQEVK
jgi:hypothetical protein